MISKRSAVLEPDASRSDRGLRELDQNSKPQVGRNSRRRASNIEQSIVNLFDFEPWVRFDSHDRPLVMAHVKRRNSVKKFSARHYFLELRRETPPQCCHNPVVERATGFFFSCLGIDQETVTCFSWRIKMAAEKLMNVLDHDGFIAGELNGEISRERFGSIMTGFSHKAPGVTSHKDNGCEELRCNQRRGYRPQSRRMSD